MRTRDKEKEIRTRGSRTASRSSRSSRVLDDDKRDRRLERTDGMEVDGEAEGPKSNGREIGGELKIRGQAAAEKRRSKWEEEDRDEVRSSRG